MFRRLTIQVTLNAGGSYQKPSLPVQEVEKGMWEKKYEKRYVGGKVLKFKQKQLGFKNIKNQTKEKTSNMEIEK